jgi:hypothetical protein
MEDAHEMRVFGDPNAVQLCSHFRHPDFAGVFLGVPLIKI